MADKKSQSLSSLYKVSGDKIEKESKFCPKCGPGVFMGKHKNRYACGKCHYTEYSKN